MASPVLSRSQKKKALDASRPVIESKLTVGGLTWDDLVPIFPLVTDAAQVEKLAAEPFSFCEALWKDKAVAAEAAHAAAVQASNKYNVTIQARAGAGNARR